MNEEVENLLKRAGRREPIAPARTERVRAAAREAWRSEVRRRTIRRRVLLAAAAAGLVLAVALGVLRRGTPSTAPPPVFLVDSVAGSATAGPGDPLARGSRLAIGSEIRTAEDGRIAFRLPAGSSVRLDASSALRLVGPEEVALDRGAVYVDSGLEVSSLVVGTPLGEVRETGTQFEVRLEDGALRVRLREGAVSVRRGGVAHDVPAGEELLWDAEGRVSRRTVPSHGPEWDWAVGIAPMLDLEGRTVRELLEWAAREQGWTLAYADPTVERAAREVVLAAAPATLTPEEALEAVLPACRMTHRVAGGVLEVSGETGTAPAVRP